MASVLHAARTCWLLGHHVCVHKKTFYPLVVWQNQMQIQKQELLACLVQYL